MLLSSAADILNRAIERGRSGRSCFTSEDGAADSCAVAVHWPVRSVLFPASPFRRSAVVLSGLTFDASVVTGAARTTCGWLKILGVATGGLGLALVFWAGVGGFKADAATLRTVSRVHYTKTYRLPLQKIAVPGPGPVPGPAPAVRVLQTPYARRDVAPRSEDATRRANTTARPRTTQSKRASTEK